MSYHRATFGIGCVTAIDTSVTPNQAYDIIVRGISIEFKASSVPLKVNLAMPIDRAIGEVEITGKIETADSPALLAPLIIPGTTSTTGRAKMAIESAVPTANVITVAQSANFRKNLGVVDLTAGKRMTRAADGTAQASLTSGQFALNVATGAYTFATADATHTFQVRYSYNSASSGKTTSWTNQALGASTGFELEVYDPTGGTKEAGYFFPAVKFGNLSAGMKANEWSSPGLDFEVFPDATGKPFDIWSDD